MYNAATALSAPFVAAYLAVHPKHRRLLARFSPAVPQVHSSPIWIQACSVGEVNATLPLIAALRERMPKVPVVLTVSTRTGHDLATSVLKDTPVTWFPFDYAFSVSRFVRALKPRMLVLVETEIWPNAVRIARRAGAPVIVVNGRLSDKHFGKYEKLRNFLMPVFSRISAAGMQNEEFARRIASLGVSEDTISVTGNTKFDATPKDLSEDERSHVRKENGFGPNQPILVFGSTRPGDEQLALRSWTLLRESFPELGLIVAPRHLNRLDDALKPFKDVPILLRSDILKGKKPSGEKVLVVDTFGELTSFYAIASVAVIGGSFFPGVNGHNPIEAAALGIPVVFGPYMRSFPDPARVLLDYGAARSVADPESLAQELAELLSSAEKMRAMSKSAKEAIAANKGAIKKTVDLIEKHLR